MPTITFSEQSVGTLNPFFTFDDNVVRFNGIIWTDSSNPTSPVFAGSTDYQAPITVIFDTPVESVSLDAGYFDNIGSTIVTFFDETGAILAQFSNGGLGILPFSLFDASGRGIAAVQIQATSTEAAGFAIDNFAFGSAISPILPPQGSLGFYPFGSEGNLPNLVASLGMIVLTNSIGGADDADFFNFTMEVEANLTFIVFWTDDPAEATPFTVHVVEGGNQLRFDAPDGLADPRSYAVQLVSVEVLGADADAQLAKWEQWGEGVDIFNGTALEVRQQIFDVIKSLNLADLPKAVKTYNSALGLAGTVGEWALNVEKYITVANSGGDWQREFFIDAVDSAAQFVIVRGAALATLSTGVWALILAPVTAIGTYFVYDQVFSDTVRSWANTAYSEFLVGEAPQMSLADVAAAEAVELTAFDPDWYLATYADAAEAVQSGQYASAYLHYLAVGLGAGYLPHENGPVLSPDQVSGGGADWANVPIGTLTPLIAPLGGLHTDSVNSGEASFLAALNDYRQGPVELDPALSALANRKAMDLALNGDLPPASAFVTNPEDWAALWSDGQPLEAGPGLVLQNYGAGYLLAAYVDDYETVEEVLDAFRATADNLPLLQSLDIGLAGVGEYGGVWVLVLAAGPAPGPVSAEPDGVEIHLAGTHLDDILSLGTHVGEANGFAGNDEITGSLGGGAILYGGDGDDLLRSGPQTNATASAPDIVNGAGASNSTFETALAVDGFFDLDADANIDFSTEIPHATIVGAGSGGARYFAFTVAGPGTAVFDVDGTSGFDAYLTLYNAAGEQLAFDDDGSSDPGSTTSLDSYLTYTFAEAGTYVIRLSAFPGGSNPIPVDAPFTLHISAPAETTPTLDAADALHGDAGDDTLQGSSAADLLDGGAGTDSVDYASNPAGVTVRLDWQIAFDGWGSQDQLVGVENASGSEFGDALIGSAGANRLEGGAGADWIVGAAGDDVFVQGIQNGAPDRLFGDAGADTIDYASASAAVTVQLSGYSTSGAVTLATFTGIENAIGTAFNDALIGNAANNRIVGGAGADWLVGAAGDDVFVQGLEGGIDRLFGDAGIDTIDYSGASAGVTVQLSGYSVSGTVTLATFTGIENAIGTVFNDALIGNASDNRITGGAGADWLVGSAGNDVFVQSNDASSIDRLFGDAGIDTIDYSGASAAVTVQLSGYAASGAVTLATFTGIENTIGTAFNDALIGNASDNRITGGAGADWLVGGAGNDVFAQGLEGGGVDRLFGDAGIDTIDYSSAGAAVTVQLSGYAASGGATLATFTGIENAIGTAFNDALIGNASGNRLTGGAGADWLVGQGGADAFVYQSFAAGTDAIADFSRTQLDRIDLSAIDPGAAAGDQQFIFSTVRTAGQTGEIVATSTSATTTVLSLYLNADNVADQVINVIHQSGLVMNADDFVL